jgi:hypothetical protein
MNRNDPFLSGQRVLDPSEDDRLPAVFTGCQVGLLCFCEPNLTAALGFRIFKALTL